MQYQWLNKKNNNKLILFLNGWAMNESAVEHLNKEDFDILMINDYRNFELDFSQFNFEKYSEKYLICWSMGVYVSNLFIEEFNCFNKKIAINGTNKIIDDNFGIPKKIYNLTVKFFNETSCDKFIKNIFNGNINSEIKITNTIEELKEELISIQNIKTQNETIFDKAIISKEDIIIPTKNQIAYWQDKTKLEIIDSAHYPFKNYTSWKELLC